MGGIREMTWERGEEDNLFSSEKGQTKQNFKHLQRKHINYFGLNSVLIAT
ncbi:hypothetical protein I3842_05G126900 [Carya illinoinensis]|uniref:Uncharacterized protein n=1 Tax=Carya illinoinensis TaxID=32201 RepID=A0A922EZB6_CARIL|nr:hypothetical protein I3842_05G126900 [Carya illinoinensis]